MLLEFAQITSSRAVYLSMDVVLWVASIVETSFFRAEAQLSEVVVVGVVYVS